ncbi:MAG: metal ABC transporter permease [Pirellulales bacterium]|nr:metal ABC transporter permease [Pirellulales bacterium]
MNYLTTIVLLGTSALGSVAGVLGSFALLRRRALMGDLLSHAALPGLCLAFLVMGQRHFAGMLLGALLTGLAGVVLITIVCRFTRTREDAALGIVLSTFFGAGIVLSSIIQHRPDGGAKAGLESYIYGQAVGMNRQDLYLIAGVSLAALSIVAMLFKEFKVLSFDPGFARAQGWPTWTLDMAMMGTLALVTVIGLPAVGVVLMAAMLILPGATARFWTDRLGPMLLLAGLIGGATGGFGTLLSAGVVKQWLGFDPLRFGDTESNLPTGPVIVLSGTALFLFSVFFAPQRGVLARLWSEMRLRRKIGRENLLRTLYELSEPALASPAEISIDQLLRRRAWSRPRAHWLLWRATRSGLVAWGPGGARLTQPGVAEAARLVRAHRLWELFLIRGAHIAPDHVDRDADAIEHLLTPELLGQLQTDLAAAGVAAVQIPPSPHDLSRPDLSASTEPDEEPPRV